MTSLNLLLVHGFKRGLSEEKGRIVSFGRRLQATQLHYLSGLLPFAAYRQVPLINERSNLVLHIRFAIRISQHPYQRGRQRQDGIHHSTRMFPIQGYAVRIDVSSVFQRLMELVLCGLTY